MTRNSCVSARICGSHMAKVQPSEFDSISVGPPSRPSTETLSRQPLASIIGMFVTLVMRGLDPRIHLKRVYSRRWIAGSSPAMTSGLLQRSEQAVDQGLRDALIGHRLKQFCDLLGAKMRGDLRLGAQHVAQVLFVRDRLLAGRLDQMVRLALADLFGQRECHRFRH